MDLQAKEKYADNIYLYLIKRTMFRNLILNYEMNKVAYNFVVSINERYLKKVNKIIKIDIYH